MLKRREADAAIEYQVDRLSRDIVDLLATVRMWPRAGVEVHTCDIGKIESELDIVLVLKGWQGSDERKKIIECCSRGRNGKARQGKVVCSGYAPFGYKYMGDSLEILEHEARLVRLVYDLYVKECLSVYHIAQKLSEMRIPTPGERYRRERKRDTGVWDRFLIYRMLSNELYAGVWRYGETVGYAGRGGKRPLSDQIAVNVPAIIDRETWNAAQARREYNKHQCARRDAYPYMLRGMVKCGECEGALTGYSAQARDKVNRYYRCSRVMHRVKGVEIPRCTNTLCARIDQVEPFAWTYVNRVIRETEEFEAVLQKAQDEELAQLEPKREQLSILIEQIGETEGEAAEIAAAHRAAQRAKREGAVAKNLLADMERIESLYADQNERRTQLEKELAQRKYTDERLNAGFDNPTDEEKRRMMQSVNTQVIVKDGKAFVVCLIPAEPGVLPLVISKKSRATRSKFWVGSKLRI